MRLFRKTLISERTYILVNIYFHRIVDRNWTPGQPQGVSIHSCVLFIADIVDGNRGAIHSPSVSRGRMEFLIETHFPRLAAYLTVELETLGAALPDSHFHSSTNLDLAHLKRCIMFYRVSELFPRNTIIVLFTYEMIMILCSLT